MVKKLIDLAPFTSSSSTGTMQPGGMSNLWTNATTATFYVKNLGDTDGNEVAQLYLVNQSAGFGSFSAHLSKLQGFPPAAGEPPRVLRGFDRQFIASKAVATFSMTLTVKEISIWYDDCKQ